MMPPHIRFGLSGEHKAAVYLRENGYTMLFGNYRSASGEIDIIAESDECLCFVEVKTRKQGGVFPPAEAVDINKQENVRSTAAHYRAAYYDPDKPDRFDIIEVELSPDGLYSVNHIKNAF